jgi:aerobic carbon-monoxide dehydrogenase large subunit
MSINTYVGSPVERVEDMRFLRGKGTYIADFARAGQLHAVFLRSPVAHGHIRKLDVAAAAQMKGVRGVITGQDLPRPIPKIPFRRPNPTIAPYAQPVIASGKVRYVGEPVAMVLADTAELAEDALQAILLEIDVLPAVVDTDASLAGKTRLFEGTDTNVAATFIAKLGDADAIFRDAPYVRRERFYVQRQTALPMETRGLLADWNAQTGRMTVHGAAKLPFFSRRTLAALMSLEETAVDYIELDVGGGFGARGEFYPEDFLVAHATRAFDRPVKWVEDRREHFMTIAHSREANGEIEIACSNDGDILGLRGTIDVNIGAYVRPNGMTPVRNVVQFLCAPYRVRNIDLQARALVSNKTPSGTYRGPGRYEGCFFCERMLELAARDLGLDRLDIRRRNLLSDSDMPYPLAPVRPNDGFGDTACDSGDYRVTFDRCLEEFGWKQKQSFDGALIDGCYHGVAVGCFVEGGGSGPRENARMRARGDGTIEVYVGSSAIGQGIETIMAQIAADALELPIERIKIMHGSTSYLWEGFGSYGSRATVMGGSAIFVTAQNLLQAFRMAAARRLAVEPERLTIVEGIAKAPDGRQLSLAESAAEEELGTTGTFSNSKATYSYGTAAAHVAVDAGTGSVEVLDYVVVDDVGRIVNPETLHGQITGATVQGLGAVFGEHLQYDAEGQLLVGSLADHPLPVATDYPDVRAISLELYPSPNNPLGAKGAGEGGIIPVAAVLSNAVASALASCNVQPNALPLTPARLWELIERARLQKKNG